MKQYLLSLLLVLLLTISSSGGLLADSPDSQIAIAEQTYPVRRLLDGFFQASINKHLKIDSPFPGFMQANQDSEQISEIKKRYPWLYPYMFSQAGVPNFNAISRWEKPVTIALGAPDRSATTSAIKPNSESVAAKEINNILPNLIQLTGLDMALGDRTADANLRVVFVNSLEADRWATKYKKGPGVVVPPIHSDREAESFIETAIFFTPALGFYQVDGYFVANSKNEIQFAVCYIRDDHTEQITRKLVRECLLRSLGFSDAQNVFPNSYLSLWNVPPFLGEKFGIIYETMVDVLGEQIASTVILYAWPRGLGGLSEEAKGFVGENENAFSSVDEYFVHLLYSDTLKPGMNHIEARNVLYLNLLKE